MLQKFVSLIVLVIVLRFLSVNTLDLSQLTNSSNTIDEKIYEFHPQISKPPLIVHKIQEFVQHVTEVAIESVPLLIKTNFTNPPPNRANPFEWFLGVIGLRPPTNEVPSNEPPRNCPKCTCGLTYVNKRIVGGIETRVNQYPWMVALTYSNRFYCGASLINNKYILTAAHCVNGFAKERLQAVFLDHDRSNSFETRTFSRKIRTIIRHRNYGSGGTYNNDIALLKLDQDINLAGIIRPVCLPTVGRSFTGYNGIAVGWGATQEHGQVTSKLREVEVPILSNIACRRTGYGTKITDNMLCAGFLQGGKDSCQGDSGGPLHVTNNTFHSVAGVVSWGEGCAEPNYPGVYTRVNRYITWIKSNTKDACYC